MNAHDFDFWVHSGPVLEAALDYAARGWPVFPVPPGTKKSYRSEEMDGTRWGATTDPARIRDLWRMYPQANVGVVTGAASGLMGFDVDTPKGHGRDGFATLRALEETHGALPRVPNYSSPSAGKMYLFAHAPGITNTAGVVGPGIDIRGDGGMIVMPPSVKPGVGSYLWDVRLDQAPILPPPDWLVALYKKPREEPRAREERDTTSPRNEPYLRKAWECEIEAVRTAPAGSRNDQLNRSAFCLGQLVGGGEFTESEVAAALFAAAEAAGLVAEDGRVAVEKTIRSGLTKGVAQPRRAPEPPIREGHRFADKANRTWERARASQAHGEAGEQVDPDTGEVLSAEDLIDPDAGVLTQDYVARVYEARHRDAMRYDASVGSWFSWTGSRWRQDGTDKALQFCREIARELSVGEKDGTVREARRYQFARGVENFARGAMSVTADCWDADPYLLGTPDGTVDLRTGSLRPPDPADGISKSTAVSPREVPDCRIWLRFLDEATGGDRELIRFLQQWCGYCLTGDTIEHALVFFYGPGGNGKSVFLNTVAGLLGDYAVAAPMETFTASKHDRHPTELASLKGARVVTASETEEGRAWAEAKIKQLTGGDRIRARFMRQDFFEFSPTFKILIAGNHRPVLSSTDDAIRRRFRIVAFNRRPATPDPQLEVKLRAEFPAILRWMIEGCLDWQANGLIVPASVKAETEDYFAEQDTLGQWLDECCDVERDNLSKTATVSELFAGYRDYATKAGETVGSSKSFSSALKQRGFVKAKGHGGTRIFKGLRLKPTMRSMGGDQ